jgi:hypothetical protein
MVPALDLALFKRAETLAFSLLSFSNFDSASRIVANPALILSSSSPRREISVSVWYCSAFKWLSAPSSVYDLAHFNPREENRDS